MTNYYYHVKRYYDEYATCEEKEVEEIGADEWGILNSFIDKRQKKKKFKLIKKKEIEKSFYKGISNVINDFAKKQGCPF